MHRGNTNEPPIGARTGTMIFAIMGIIWWLAASNGVEAPWIWPFIALGAAIGLVVAITGFRRTRNEGPMDSRQVRRTYNLVNLGQLVGILLTVFVCVRLERPELIAPIIAAIVGVHFLPFRKLFRWNGYGVVCGGFVLVALAGLVAALASGRVETSLLVTGMGCAVVLWSGALALVRASVIS